MLSEGHDIVSAPPGRERGRWLDLVRAQEVRRKCPIEKKGLAPAIQSLRHDFRRMSTQKGTPKSASRVFSAENLSERKGWVRDLDTESLRQGSLKSLDFLSAPRGRERRR